MLPCTMLPLPYVGRRRRRALASLSLLLLSALLAFLPLSNPAPSALLSSGTNRLDPAGPSVMWRAAPKTQDSLRVAGRWSAVRNTSVTFTLARHSFVLFRYHMGVVADKPEHPGGDFLHGSQLKPGSTGLGDFVGARLVVDGAPYRGSGSHAAPLGSAGTAAQQLSGTAIIELGPGTHTATLQWRHRRASSAFRDGHSSSRGITVTSDHRYMWFAQPINVGYLSKAKAWQAVKGMCCSSARWPT